MGQSAKLRRLRFAVKIYIKTWFSMNKSDRFNEFTPLHSFGADEMRTNAESIFTTSHSCCGCGGHLSGFFVLHIHVSRRRAIFVVHWLIDIIGLNVLYLNVPAIAILRPNQLFGRTIVDFASPCARRTYLAITKAVGRPRKNNGYGSSIAGGYLGHDLVSAFATGVLPKNYVDGPALLNFVSDETLSELVWLGMASDADTDLSIACNRGLQSLETVMKSNEIQKLFSSDQNWIAESDALNNGVSASPDLMATRTVVEIKQVDMRSEKYDEKKLMRQVEGYLAWAMVEFGLNEVVDKWRGVLLNIHDKTEPSDRIKYCKPDPNFVGWRILNRHKQLGSVSGRWLPSPNIGECDFCEFSRPTTGREKLAAPCTYYCQAERNWNCIDEERECPLLGICDQHDRFEPYERVDLFNRLRRDMLEEEEEQDITNGILKSVSKVGAQSTVILGEFTLNSVEGSRVSISIPKSLSNLTFARYGDRFSAVSESGLEIGRWRFLKRKRDTLIFETHCMKPVETGSFVSLRFEPGGRHPVREQLSWLDVDQRSGDLPLSLKLGTQRGSEVPVRNWKHLDDLPDDANFVVVNVFEKAQANEEAIKLLNGRLSGASVLLVADNFDRIKNAAIMTADNFRGRLLSSSGTLFHSISDLVKSLRESKLVCVGQEDLSNGRVVKHVERNGKFDFTVALDAEEMHLLALSKCINASSRGVFIIGNRESMGPRVEAANVRGSLLGQNTVRYLTDVGPAILPEPIKYLDVVNLAIRNGAAGLEQFPKIHCSIESVVPIELRVAECVNDFETTYFRN